MGLVRSLHVPDERRCGLLIVDSQQSWRIVTLKLLLPVMLLEQYLHN